jgi:hypothetical protein
MLNTNEDAIKYYCSQGYSIIPVKYSSKKPLLSGWQKQKLDEAEMLSHADGRYINIGLRLGEASGGLVDIDLDALETWQLAAHFLPQTNMVFGRASKPRSHYIYKCVGELPKSTKFADKTESAGDVLLEVRSDGKHQTVVPPSVHESTELIRFCHDDPRPSEISASELLRSVSLLLIAALCVRYYPKKGTRNDVMLALAGALLTHGYSIEESRHLFSVITGHIGDEESESRLKALEGTYERISNDENVVGLPTLENQQGEVFVMLLKSAMKLGGMSSREGEDTIGKIVESMNIEYAFILVGGKAAVLREGGQKKTGLHLLSMDGFNKYLANQKIVPPDGKQPFPISKLWLEHPKRRTYDGIEFNPSGTTKGYYNLFSGFPIQPRAGDCQKFLTHIYDNVAAGDGEIAQWVIGWFADIIQNPGRKVGTSLVLRGQQGTGKTIVGELFGSLLGEHYVVVANPRLITGNFNAHLKSCILLHAEEAFFAGDKQTEGALKHMVTSDKGTLELKGKDAVPIDNFVRLLVTTNSSWAIPAGFEERRFAVLDVGDAQKQNGSYFAAIIEEMKNGGKAALMDYLMKFDLSSVDIRKIPTTAALLEQKISSMDDISRWWLDALMGGSIGGSGEWVQEIETSLVQNAYIGHSKNSGTTRRSIQTQLGTWFSKHVHGLKVQRRGGRTFYVLPPLRECREAFDKRIGHKIEWPEDDEYKSPF